MAESTDVLREANKKAAFEAIRQAGDAVEAAHWVGFFASRPEPTMAPDILRQRAMFLQLANKLIEHELERLMDTTCAAWKHYKETQ